VCVVVFFRLCSALVMSVGVVFCLGVGVVLKPLSFAMRLLGGRCSLVGVGVVLSCAAIMKKSMAMGFGVFVVVGVVLVVLGLRVLCCFVSVVVLLCFFSVVMWECSLRRSHDVVVDPAT
jgi:hypothetical protein